MEYSGSSELQPVSSTTGPAEGNVPAAAPGQRIPWATGLGWRRGPGKPASAEIAPGAEGSRHRSIPWDAGTSVRSVSAGTSAGAIPEPAEAPVAAEPVKPAKRKRAAGPAKEGEARRTVKLGPGGKRMGRTETERVQ